MSEVRSELSGITVNNISENDHNIYDVGEPRRQNDESDFIEENELMPTPTGDINTWKLAYLE